MKFLSRIWFPVAVAAAFACGFADLDNAAVDSNPAAGTAEMRDTVIYPANSYKIHHKPSSGNTGPADTSEAGASDSLEVGGEANHLSPKDSLKALLDPSLWNKLDSIYTADSAARAKAKFEAWYKGLSKDARKKYDLDQKIKRNMARADSLRTVKEALKDERDSISEARPRILETYALPDSAEYKRIIAWTVDQDFNKMNVYVPDTSYNYHYYDYPFQRKDVNASWLGVAGSPVQYYNYFNRKSIEGVDFYDAQEAWSYSPGTLPQYNTKTPYTELAYYGTLLAGKDKESDNLHIFTTQNITPEFNFGLLYERFGGEGLLENESTTNKTAAVQANYLGKKYTMHAGFIHNMVERGENGGIVDNKWIRDTTVDSRDIAVALTSASSKIKKNTVFLDQQLRIPFSFIDKIKARKDSSYVFKSDSLVRDITTAFIGHSSEFSTYSRKYVDAVSDTQAADFYNSVFNYSKTASADSLRMMKLDNKVYIRLQPWSSQGIISKLDIGAGDYIKSYYNQIDTTHQTQNSFYVYAGAQGQFRSNFFWDAKARYVLLGHDFGDMGIEANGQINLYPFRRARHSPVSVGVHFETTLLEPGYYQQHLYSNHFSWNNSFSKISTTKVQGTVNIPRWNFNASVGYALLGNNIYYGTDGIIRQNGTPMSVLSGAVREELILGPLHLDNRALLQVSSNPDVIPLPAAAFNLRYFLQFVVQRKDSKNVMVMQIGANAFYNTAWNSPAWNPNLGVFHNQTKNTYNNGPYFDVFVNVQWKRACVFIKYQNAGGGWPMNSYDYFSADHYIVTGNGLSGLKLGIFWPFYTQPKGLPPANR